MRKYGIGFMIFGGVLGAILFFVRSSAWYHAAQTNNLSEPAQLVEAAFWACVITLALGVVFFLLSLRRPTEEEPEAADEYEDEPYEEPYEEPGETYVPSYTQPFDYDAYEAPQPVEYSEPTRRIPDPYAPESQQTGWDCAICGCRNPGFSAVCAVCGASRETTLS